MKPASPTKNFKAPLLDSSFPSLSRRVCSERGNRGPCERLEKQPGASSKQAETLFLSLGVTSRREGTAFSKHGDDLVCHVMCTAAELLAQLL